VNKSFPQAFWSVVVIGVTLIALALIGIGGVQRLRVKTYTIDVTGSAVKTIRSDLAVWSFSVSYSGYDEYKSLYQKLKPVPQEVEAFLRKQGLDLEDIEVGASQVNANVESKDVDCKSNEDGCRTVVKDKIPLRYKTVSRTLYTVSRYFIVESTKVDLVIKASNAVDALFDRNIVVGESDLRLIYTKLAELRLELVKAASEDAFKRATLIAEPVGRRITMIEDGRLGVFQINAKNDPSISDVGNFDTSSLEKDVRAIVNATYRIE
jgi:uncharacterized protein